MWIAKYRGTMAFGDDKGCIRVVDNDKSNIEAEIKLTNVPCWIATTYLRKEPLFVLSAQLVPGGVFQSSQVILSGFTQIWGSRTAKGLSSLDAAALR